VIRKVYSWAATIIAVALLVTSVYMLAKVRKLEASAAELTDAAAQLVIAKSEIAIMRKTTSDLYGELVKKRAEWSGVLQQVDLLQGELDSAYSQLSIEQQQAERLRGDKVKLEQALDLWSQTMSVSIPECDKDGTIDMKCRAKIAGLRVAQDTHALTGELSCGAKVLRASCWRHRRSTSMCRSGGVRLQQLK